MDSADSLIDSQREATAMFSGPTWRCVSCRRKIFPIRISLADYVRRLRDATELTDERRGGSARPANLRETHAAGGRVVFIGNGGSAGDCLASRWRRLARPAGFRRFVSTCQPDHCSRQRLRLRELDRSRASAQLPPFGFFGGNQLFGTLSQYPQRGGRRHAGSR